jgi:hypothetical protein
LTFIFCWNHIILIPTNFFASLSFCFMSLSMTTLSTDRDSLLALDALLRIRDCMQRDDAILAGNMNAMIPPGAFPQVGALSGFSLPMGAGMALRQSTGTMYLPSHVAALEAAAASASNGQMYRSAPPKSFGIGSNESNQLPSILPALFGGRNATPESPTNASEERSNANPPPSKAAVRIEKVEAALKSKPQRGRKRDNLNVMERMELTRTRNREHAKSTRYG